METSHSEFTIYDLIVMFQRKELIVNKNYQRNPGVWPDTAKSYFIDTILEKFPFPKIYLYQNYDKKGNRPYKEIVDGQQRFTAIFDFYSNKFSLTSVSKKFAGKKYEELDEETKEHFLTSRVHTDVLLNADEASILELFRRMNSYTVPLNEHEKRNAEFQGKFKWYINELSEKYSEKFQQWSIFSPREIIRMKDMDFLSDISVMIDAHQISSKSSPQLKKLYSTYNENFAEESRYKDIITTTFDAIFELNELMGSFMCKDYALYSLFAAMAHLNYGILDQNASVFGNSKGYFYHDRNNTVDRLLDIAAAHENKDTQGRYASYVSSAINTTTKRPQRIERIKTIIAAIG